MDLVKFAVASRQVSGVTGTTTTILEHARRLVSRGWEVHVYGDDLDVRRLRGCGASAHRIWRLPSSGFLKRRYFNWRFERRAATGNFDLVSGHGDTLRQDVLSLHNCVHAAYEAVHGEPLVEAGSGVGRLHGQILREQDFRLLIANSRLMRADVMARFGVPEEKIAVIHPGYDANRFRPQDRALLGAPLRAELRVGPSDILVGLITSGDFVKRGVGGFLAGLARLSPATKAKVRALVVGSESRLSGYRKLAAETGLGERIRFLPVTSEVERYFHALDVYVHPALFEEFGQSVQEAMACGVAVLTSRRVGAAELFPEQARDWLMDRPDSELIAAKLEAMIAETAARRGFGAALADAVRANTWETNFKTTWDRYQGLLRLKYNNKHA